MDSQIVALDDLYRNAPDAFGARLGTLVNQVRGE
jgi:hypothetical protein